MAVYSGPVRQGKDEGVFRRTGKEVDKATQINPTTAIVGGQLVSRAAGLDSPVSSSGSSSSGSSRRRRSSSQTSQPQSNIQNQTPSANEVQNQRQARAQASQNRQALIQVARQQKQYNFQSSNIQTNTGEFGTPIRDNDPDERFRATPGTRIEKRQTGTYEYEGREIPVTETFLIEPPKSGVGQYTETKVTGRVTSEGEVFSLPGYEDVTIGNELEAKEVSRATITLQNLKGGIVGAYENLNTGIRESITEPTIGRIDFDKARTNVKESTEFLINRGVSPAVAKSGEFVSGFGLGLAEDVKNKPLKYVSIVVASAGVGLAVGGATAGASSGASALFGTRAGLIAGASVKVATTGAGLYFSGKYASETITRIKESGDVFEGGSIAGITFGESIAGITGYKFGRASFNKLRGYWATRGRTYIDIPQGEYPQANTRNQLEMFKNNYYPELGDRPGAFHTTSDIFWKGGSISPQAGTSELPGLYASTQISTPFSRIPGSSSGSRFSITNFIKNIITPEGKPGVVYLQPEGFRYSPTGKIINYIDGQRFTYKWNIPSRQGFADVPGIKTEIEAIFRPDAGGYKVTGRSFYTKINNVRVPIDTAIYDINVPTSTNAINIVGGQGSYSGSGISTSSISTSPGITTYVSPSFQTDNTYSVSSQVKVSPETSFVTIDYSSLDTSSSVIPTGSGGSGRPSRSSRRSSSIPTSSSVIPPTSNVYKTPSSPKPSSSSIISNIYRGSSSGRPSGFSAPKPFYKRQSRQINFKQPRQTGFQGFQVFGRRFGKFSLVGIGKTESQAYTIGKRFASQTLGATFKVPKGRRLKLPGFKTKKTKVGEILFIEPIGKRLKKGTGEIPEIQTFMKVKGGKKK